MEPMPDGAITVVLADDNLIVRAGVRALLAREPDVEVVGEAADHAELIAAATSTSPRCVVSDIRMPPTFQREGIDAAKEIRKRHPGTGVVILSQYDDPEYAMSLLADGAAGYAYLLKDRLAEGDQLVDAIRAVATGGTAARPGHRRRPGAARAAATTTSARPTRSCSPSSPRASPSRPSRSPGRPPRRRWPTTSSSCSSTLAKGASTGGEVALRRLRLLHQAIVDREEQGETLSRLLPGGLAEKLRLEGKHIGESEEVEVTVLMSDIRSYSSIAERTAPTQLAAQLNEHRAAMNGAILGAGGTVMQFVGDAVMAVFGAPFPQDDHCRPRRWARPLAMHRAQDDLNRSWAGTAREEFLLGIGLSTGKAAAALLGSEERLEYTLVGDTVNLAQRLQEMARPGGQTILSEATWSGLTDAARGHAEPARAREGAGHARHHLSDRTRDLERRMTTTEPSVHASPDVGHRPRARRAGASDDLRGRERPGARPARRRLPDAPRRVRRHHGARRAAASPPCSTSSPASTRPTRARSSSPTRRSPARPRTSWPGCAARHIGIVFQFFNLLEGMTVLENVALPAMVAGLKRKPAETRARDLLDLLGLSDKAKAAPGSLSGGQRQRLAIARALANEPTLLLADEPTGALDSEGGHEVIELFRRLHQGGQTILMVTHDDDVAAAAQRIARMKDGKVVQPGLGVDAD